MTENAPEATEVTAPAAPAKIPPSAITNLAGLDPEVVLRALNVAWREVKDQDAPTLLQLMAAGGAQRVEVDLASGYLAVTAGEDKWLAFNFRRDFLPALVAVLTGRPEAVVRPLLEKGPARVEREAAPSAP